MNKLYCIVLYCIVLYCIVLYCIVLYCIVLYCIVLYCIAQCIMVGCIYVRVHGTFPTFSYSDLNPTGLSPRTGYFENFQSYTAVIYSKFYGPFASHRLTIFHATCDEIYSSCQRTNGSWNGQYYLQWSVLLPSL